MQEILLPLSVVAVIFIVPTFKALITACFPLVLLIEAIPSSFDDHVILSVESDGETSAFKVNVSLTPIVA